MDYKQWSSHERISLGPDIHYRHLLATIEALKHRMTVAPQGWIVNIRYPMGSEIAPAIKYEKNKQEGRKKKTLTPVMTGSKGQLTF